jgi:hypothetical protein
MPAPTIWPELLTSFALSRTKSLLVGISEFRSTAWPSRRRIAWVTRGRKADCAAPVPTIVPWSLIAATWPASLIARASRQLPDR